MLDLSVIWCHWQCHACLPLHCVHACNHANAQVLLIAATMGAPSKDSLLAAWLTDDGRIEGLPCEAVPDLHAYELWSVATKPAAQAAEDVKEQVQKCKMAWLKANTVKGRLLVHKVGFMLVVCALVERSTCRANVNVPTSCLRHCRRSSDIRSSVSLITIAAPLVLAVQPFWCRQHCNSPC